MKCTNCQGYLLASEGQKTKICPYCGTHVNLYRAQRIATANTAREASEILKQLKSDKGFT
jgi:acetyl-CoA carboxylase beta subunit